MIELAPVLGVLAGVIGIADTVPYMRDIIRGVTRLVPKTYRDPDSETLVTFAFACLGGALAAGAVGAVDASLLLYPIYYWLVNGAIAVLIHHRRAVMRSGARQSVLEGSVA